jgi:CheY-like chemotaxis protein
MTNPTILVVEDNPDHLELTLTTLQENGLPHHIVVARDGLEALEYLFCQGLYSDRDPNKQPELVLMDLGMPKMNGLQLIQRMRDDPRTFFVPVIMLTASSVESEAVLAFKGGLNSYVSKPLDFRDFEAKLEEIREYWRISDLAPLSP